MALVSHSMFRLICFAVASVAVAGAVAPGWAQSSPPVLKPFASLTLAGDLVGKKGDPAEDISGMACFIQNGAERACLVINDENRQAQIVTLKGTIMSPGAEVPLIGTGPAGILGKAPFLTCGDAKKFNELDGEAVAFAKEKRFLYVTGSHGCARNSSSYRLSSFVLVRLPVNENGSLGAAEKTFRLSDVLSAAAEVKPYFGATLFNEKTGQAENGLNIEGMAAIGDKLWFGLRAPVTGPKSFLVGVNADALFAAGDGPWQGSSEVIGVELGAGRGIRELASLPDGRLLILSGPAQEQDINYQLHLLDPDKPAIITALGTIAAPASGKAESVTVLDSTKTDAEILIMFDGVRGGGGQFFKITFARK